MATMSSMALVTKRVEHLRMKVEGPMVTPEAVASIVPCVSKAPKISIEDASTLHHAISSIILPEKAKQTIHEAIDAKVIKKSYMAQTPFLS